MDKQEQTMVYEIRIMLVGTDLADDAANW